MTAPACSSCQNTEQTIIELSHWLFNQDVKLITFFQHLSQFEESDSEDLGDAENAKGPEDMEVSKDLGEPEDAESPEHAPGGYTEFTAFIVPKLYTLQSLASLEVDCKVLMVANAVGSRELALAQLLRDIQQEIGEAMYVGYNGKI